MTAQVTSERIPRHNPTAKPKLNGLDVPLSAQKIVKYDPYFIKRLGASINSAFLQGNIKFSKSRTNMCCH